jgi:hypothetical protein
MDHVLLLITGGFIQRRRRIAPRYAQDELPVGPLIEVLSLWILLTTGGFLGAAACAALYFTIVLDFPLASAGICCAIAMAVLSPLCFWRALIVWYRLTRR